MAGDDAGTVDTALAERFREGDREAFAQLYASLVRVIYDFLLRIVRNPAVAEDLVQSTFVRAYERRATLREPARIRSWLLAIAYHLALSHVGRDQPREAVEEEMEVETDEPGPEQETLAREARTLVWEAAGSLAPRQFAVLDLSVRKGLSTPEIAEVLGVAVSHAAVLVHRTREALGTAVRDLLVARRSRDCPQLARLLPAEASPFTAQVRETVDHHIRRCPDCQRLGAKLTSPAELFAGMPLVPLSARLAESGWPAIVARLEGGSTAGRALRRLSNRRTAVVATAGTALLGAGLFLALARANSPVPLPPPPPTPAVTQLAVAPTLAPTATEPTATAPPTATARPRSTPVRKATPVRSRPTRTPKPRPTRAPTRAPTPTRAPEPPTPTPTWTPEPPLPTWTPEPRPPTPTPEPPTPTPEPPTPTPEPTRPPEPSPTPSSTVQPTPIPFPIFF